MVACARQFYSQDNRDHRPSAKRVTSLHGAFSYNKRKTARGLRGKWDTILDPFGGGVHGDVDGVLRWGHREIPQNGMPSYTQYPSYFTVKLSTGGRTRSQRGCHGCGRRWGDATAIARYNLQPSTNQGGPASSSRKLHGCARTYGLHRRPREDVMPRRAQ